MELDVARAGAQPDRASGWYDFPTVDFKFQNSGTVTAFVRNFDILVEAVSLDTTPALAFTLDCAKGTMIVKAENSGWGPAKGCTISLKGNVIDLLIGPEKRKWSGTIPSGATVDVFTLTKQDVDVSRIRDLKRAARGPISWNSAREEYDFPVATLSPRNNLIVPTTIDWSGSDNTGERVGKKKCNAFHLYGWVVVSERGFELEMAPPISACMAPSSHTYIAFLDPDSGPGIKSYPISRAIPAGGVERFHIMLGASKSCMATVRFKFLVNKMDEVASDVFDVHIWSPIGSPWQYEYSDGDFLAREERERRAVDTWHFRSLWYAVASLPDKGAPGAAEELRARLVETMREEASLYPLKKGASSGR